MSLRPASRDQSNTARSGNGNPVVRQKRSEERQQHAMNHNCGSSLTTQSDKLPSYLRSLHHIQPARPSMVSSEPGSDVSGNLSIAQNTWKPPDQSSLHNVGRTRNQLESRSQNSFFFRRQFPSPLINLNTIQPRGRRPSLAGPSGAQRQRRDSVRTEQWWS